MAKTTSQIVAENKKEQEQKATRDAAFAKIDKQQMDPNAAAKNAAVLNGTSDKLVKNKETSEEKEIQQGSAQTIEYKTSVDQDYYICGGVGFLLGALVVFIYFRNKIKKIQEQCNAKVDEARATLDRMISVMTKE